MSAFTIRRAVASDAVVVAELAARTFKDWFSADNRAEDMELHVARSYGEAQQRREIEDRDVVTLLAEADGRAIAFAQVRRGPAPACVEGEAPVEIARFYVDRSFHGQGIAQALMREALAAARDLGGVTVWLGVWERNPRAIAFYAKSGFRDVGAQPFLLGNDLQTDRVMVRVD